MLVRECYVATVTCVIAWSPGNLTIRASSARMHAATDGTPLRVR